MDTVNGVMTALNAILWHDVVLWLLLGTGVGLSMPAINDSNEKSRSRGAPRA